MIILRKKRRHIVIFCVVEIILIIANGRVNTIVYLLNIFILPSRSIGIHFDNPSPLNPGRHRQVRLVWLAVDSIFA